MPKKTGKCFLLSQRVILFTNPAQPNLPNTWIHWYKSPTHCIFPVNNLCAGTWQLSAFVGVTLIFILVMHTNRESSRNVPGQPGRWFKMCWQFIQGGLTSPKQTKWKYYAWNHSSSTFPLNVYTAVSTKPVPRKAHNVCLTIHVLNCWHMKNPCLKYLGLGFITHT